MYRTNLLRSSDHRDCSSGEIISSICHVILQNHVIKGSCEFMTGNPVREVTTLPSLVALSLVEVEIKHICHVILQDHNIKGSCSCIS